MSNVISIVEVLQENAAYERDREFRTKLEESLNLLDRVEDLILEGYAPSTFTDTLRIISNDIMKLSIKSTEEG